MAVFGKQKPNGNIVTMPKCATLDVARARGATHEWVYVKGSWRWEQIFNNGSRVFTTSAGGQDVNNNNLNGGQCVFLNAAEAAQILRDLKDKDSPLAHRLRQAVLNQRVSLEAQLEANRNSKTAAEAVVKALEKALEELAGA